LQRGLINKSVAALFAVMVVMSSPLFSCFSRNNIPNSTMGSYEAKKGVTLYIVTSKEGCECFLELCEELRAIGDDLAAKYKGPLTVKLLDDVADASEVEPLRRAYHLFLLPYVVLVDNRGGFENVLYVKTGFGDAEAISKELQMWVAFSMSAGESLAPASETMKGE
jgi:hypothetical protein